MPFTVVPTGLATALDVNLSNESLVFISVTFATMVSTFLFSFCLVNFLYKFHYSYMSFYLYRAVLLTLIFLFLYSVNLLLLYSSFYSLLHSGKVLDNSASIHFHQCCYINILRECGTISYLYYQYTHTNKLKLGMCFSCQYLCVLCLCLYLSKLHYTPFGVMLCQENEIENKY